MLLFSFSFFSHERGREREKERRGGRRRRRRKKEEKPTATPFSELSSPSFFFPSIFFCRCFIDLSSLHVFCLYCSFSFFLKTVLFVSPPRQREWKRARKRKKRETCRFFSLRIEKKEKGRQRRRGQGQRRRRRRRPTAVDAIEQQGQTPAKLALGIPLSTALRRLCRLNKSERRLERQQKGNEGEEKGAASSSFFCFPLNFFLVQRRSINRPIFSFLRPSLPQRRERLRSCFFPIYLCRGGASEPPSGAPS